MPPFRFRLEQVLAYRRQLEEAAMQALASAVMHRDQLAQRLEQLREDEATHRARLCRPEAMESAERWLLQKYVDSLREEQKRVLRDLALAEEEVDRCRGVLVQRAQERELLDKLKEKQAVRHAKEEREQERRTYDETATLRYQPASF